MGALATTQYTFIDRFVSEPDFMLDFILDNNGIDVINNLRNYNHDVDSRDHARDILSELWNSGQIGEFLHFIDVDFDPDVDNYSSRHVRDLHQLHLDLGLYEEIGGENFIEISFPDLVKATYFPEDNFLDDDPGEHEEPGDPEEPQGCGTCKTKKKSRNNEGLPIVWIVLAIIVLLIVTD